jgi:copper ion binding protein
MHVQVFRVNGMTCGHCVRAVSDEVAKVPGVHRVDVDLGAGEVTVAAENAVEQTQIAAAVEEAGYELGPDLTEGR